MSRDRRRDGRGVAQTHDGTELALGRGALAPAAAWASGRTYCPKSEGPGTRGHYVLPPLRGAQSSEFMDLERGRQDRELPSDGPVPVMPTGQRAQGASCS